MSHASWRIKTGRKRGASGLYGLLTGISESVALDCVDDEFLEILVAARGVADVFLYHLHRRVDETVFVGEVDEVECQSGCAVYKGIAVPCVALSVNEIVYGEETQVTAIFGARVKAVKIFDELLYLGDAGFRLALSAVDLMQDGIAIFLIELVGVGIEEKLEVVAELLACAVSPRDDFDDFVFRQRRKFFFEF